MKNTFQLNCQQVNFGDIQEVIPAGYLEVVPGDSLSGSISVNLLSQPTDRIIRTRMYADIYCFYVPYRLLWEDWPQFISERNATLTIPTVSDLFPQNFEKWYTTSVSTNTALLRRCYNMIYQTRFDRKPDIDQQASGQSDTGWHGNSLQEAWNRPSTWEHSLVSDANRVDGEDISAATTTVELREAFAKDEFYRMREFYGTRYVDYLTALGIKTDENLNEEAEVLGMHHQDWTFRPTQGTDATNLAESAGHYDSTLTIKLQGKKYCKEHGLIAVMAVVRGEPMRVNGVLPPWLEKTEPEDFWSPEYESVGIKGWKNSTFDRSGNQNSDGYYTPKFEDLRKGINMNADPSSGWGTPNSGSVFGMWSTDSGGLAKYQKFISSEYDTFFHSDQNYHKFQATTQFRLRKKSPIRRHGQSRPLH